MPVKIRKIFLFSLEGFSLWDTFIQCQKFVPFLQVVQLFYLLVQYTENNHDLSNTNNKKKAKIATNLGVGSKNMLLSISFCQKYHVHVCKKNQIVEKPCLCPGIYMKITLNGVLFPNKRYSAIFSCSYSISSSFETLFNLGSGSQCPSSKHLICIKSLLCWLGVFRALGIIIKCICPTAK